MDSQYGILADIISNAIKSAFSEFAQQQRYERTYYQQPMTSTNTAFSYGLIQQQSYEESTCMYPGALNYATTSMSTTDESAYGDYLISPCSHQDNFYQPMTVSQTSSLQLITAATSGFLPRSRIQAIAVDTGRFCLALLDIHLWTLFKFKERQAVKVEFWNHNLFPKVYSRDEFKDRLLSR
jgi:hypothetical protein